VITEGHRHILEASAIDLEVAREAGIRSILDRRDLPKELATWSSELPALLFEHAGPDGRVVPQLRPDVPVQLAGEDRPRKYLFPTGSPPVLAVHPQHRHLLAGSPTVLVVEGTKQALAAVTNAPDGVLVVGIAGCYGWCSGGVPVPAWDRLPIAGADVVVAFDADVATNRNVHDAASALAEHLEILGASSVRFLNAPTTSKAGLDDYLATITPTSRREVLGRLVERAGKLPRRPAARRAAAAPQASDDPGAQFFDEDGLMADRFANAVMHHGHFALGPDGSIWVYGTDGIYHDDPHALVAITGELLGKRWRDAHHRTALALVAARLSADGRRLPDAPIGELVAVRNGMLDVATGELHPHNPKHLAFASFDVAWRPGATCPKFDAWLRERCGAQADDLLEALSLMLLPHVGQRKVPFLIGPTRSGKGTLLRIFESIVPHEHRAAVTLQSLATDRFAAARLYGKILNSAGDLSDHHVEDLSQFKMLTGDDLVSGERKFRDAFAFRNTALFVFSANNAPTVSEASRAYLARVRPYAFPHSYEGAEDQRIERELLAEREGVFVRLVEAAQRWLERRGYTPINPLVADHFARSSDPVAQFVAQALTVAEGAFLSVGDAFDRYRDWCVANGRKPLGRNNFAKRMESNIGPRMRAHTDGSGARGWRGHRAVDQTDWADEDGYDALAADVLPVSATSATSSPISLHEELMVEREGEDTTPDGGKVGTEVAEVADDPDPHDRSRWVEMEF
jgi:putative DNA primase/helicase